MRISTILSGFILIAAISCVRGKSPARVDPARAEHQTVYDIVVYGDSSGAVTAAVAAKRMGRTVILVNPTKFLGGMSASGLGGTDFGSQRKKTFGGIANEFYDAVAAHYGKTHVKNFEPHVAQTLFPKMIAEAKVPVHFNEKLDRKNGVKMDGLRIVSITTLSGRTYRAKMFIDATYVGDLMAAAGVRYTVGREAETQYGEDLAGVRRGDTSPRLHYTQRDKDHFIRKVDPYIKAGDPSSGLLPLVQKIDGLKNGQGDRKIQAYNYRLCLTQDPKLRRAIEKPAGYREIDHELLLRNFEAGDPRFPGEFYRLEGPNRKADFNSKEPVASDYGGANWEYPEAGYAKRREIEAAHELYIRGFFWTLANSPRVPQKIRRQAASWGLSRDEFTDNGNWPYMFYIREARRMVSDYVMTQQNCVRKRIARDPVGLASFGMDSHVVQYYVNEQGHVRREGVIWRKPQRPYGVSYRSIIPRKGECENLLVPICLSASHVAHGSIRMEPVYMTLGQSAATAAVLAIEDNVAVQEVDYQKLRSRLLADKQILEFARASSPARRNPKKLRGIVLDDAQAKFTGLWTRSSTEGPYLGKGYRHDENADKGKKTARFAVRLPRTGRYRVQLAYTAQSNRASNVPVEIHYASGVRTIRVNQRKAPPAGKVFLPLGIFLFRADKPAAVVISTAGTDGYVIVDGVQFLPVQ